MRRLIFPLILGLMLLASAVYGAHWWQTGRFIESTDNAQVEADSAVVAPRVAGYVARVAVTHDQPVRRGQLLFTLDARDHGAHRDRALAELARARAGTGTTTADTESERSAIGAAEAAVTAARAQAEQARADLARVAAIYADRFVTKQRYDEAVAAAASRDAEVARAEATLAAQRSRRVAASSRGGGASAAVAAARADVALAEVALSHTAIRAPFDGVVGNMSVRAGEYMRAGQRAMVIVPLGEAYVVANFKETQVARMVPGQRVRLEVDAYPDVALGGRVVSLAPASGSRFSILPPENATGNFTKIVQRIPVRVALDRPLPPGVRLAPGMSVEAEIDVRRRGDLGG